MPASPKTGSTTPAGSLDDANGGPYRLAAAGKSAAWLKLPKWAWGCFLAAAAAGWFTANPWLTFFAILLLPIFIELLWFPGEPPVMLFACTMQWLQGAIAILYTDWLGISLHSIFGGPQFSTASALSLIAVLVLAVGMRAAQFGHDEKVATQLREEARGLRPGALFVWYLVAFVGCTLMEEIAMRVAPLQQVLVAAASVRWVFVFLLAYAVLSQRRNYGSLFIVVVIEFITGIIGFFAGFKGVFFVLLVVVPSAHYLFRGWRLFQFAAIGVVVLGLAIVWSVVKGDYREFLNQGSGQQEIVVPVDQRLEKLAELVGRLDRESMAEGFETLIIRVSYVQYFAMTLIHVPESVPHENGKLWLDSIKHVMMPRLFFPDKAPLDDSERTARYTGLDVAGVEQGTSIGIGYVGESYIDLGYFGMFVPIVLLGLFYGWIYRHFVRGQRFRLMGCAIATAILIFGAYNLETSNVKLIGGNLMSFLVMALFAKFLAPLVWSAIASPPQVSSSIGRKRRRRVPNRPRTQPS